MIPLEQSCIFLILFFWNYWSNGWCINYKYKKHILTWSNEFFFIFWFVFTWLFAWLHCHCQRALWIWNQHFTSCTWFLLTKNIFFLPKNHDVSSTLLYSKSILLFIIIYFCCCLLCVIHSFFFLFLFILLVDVNVTIILRCHQVDFISGSFNGHCYWSSSFFCCDTID